MVDADFQTCDKEEITFDSEAQSYMNRNIAILAWMGNHTLENPTL